MLNEIKHQLKRGCIRSGESLWWAMGLSLNGMAKDTGYTQICLCLCICLIALLDENGELVTHVFVTRWDSLYFRPETVQRNLKAEGSYLSRPIQYQLIMYMTGFSHILFIV